MTALIDEISDVMTIPAASAYTGFNAEYLRQLCRAEKLKAFRMGKRLFVIPRAELDRYRREVR